MCVLVCACDLVCVVTVNGKKKWLRECAYARAGVCVCVYIFVRSCVCIFMRG